MYLDIKILYGTSALPNSAGAGIRECRELQKRRNTLSNVDSFTSKSMLEVNGKNYEIFRLDAVEGSQKLPFSLKVLLENLLRTEDGANITADHIRTLAAWDPKAAPSHEIQFTPARVVMQDFTGVPCIVDLATMREAVKELGGDPNKVNPLAPAELVIDHSVQIDSFGNANAIERNMDIEYQRNGERYQFLRWGQTAFDDFKVVPPGMGIVHQVNIEYLARVIMPREVDGVLRAYPDTLVGTDSHTTMVNGLGVLGWGVGGIEAEAAMLGQPVSMLIPPVVGFKLTGEIPSGVTATDVVLTITDMLRQHGVVGKFVEFYGKGVSAVPLANRATIGNMSPEFGSTAAMFPIDQVTMDYLRLTGRDEEQMALVETYAKEQGLWHDPEAEIEFSEYLELDLSTVVPSISGPKRPQDRIELSDAKSQFAKDIHNYAQPGDEQKSAPVATADGSRVRARERCGRDRLDHVLHEHVEPVRHDGGRSARAEGSREGPQLEAVGEDLDRSGLQGRHGVLREGRSHPGPRSAQLLHRRLRLHDVHRQLGSARGGDLAVHPGQRPLRLRGAVRQPQLRGPHQPRREDELPRVASAGHRLRAGRHDGLRLRGTAAGAGHGRQ